MDERCCLFLGIILCLALVSETRVIVPRALPKDGSSGNGELPLSTNPSEDKKLDLESKIWGPPIRDDDLNVFEGDKRVNHPRGPIPDDDYVGLDRRVDKIPGIIPERFPSRADPKEWPETKPEESDDTATDYNVKKTFDEEYPYIPDNNDKDLELSSDENKSVHKDGDVPEISEEFEGNDKDFKPKDDEETEGNFIPEDDEEKPDDDDEEEKERHKPKDDDDDDERSDEEGEMHKPEDDEEKPDDEDEEEEMHKSKDDDERSEEEQEKHDPEDDKEKPDEERKEEEMHKFENDDEKNDIPEEEPIDNSNKDGEMPKEIDEETVDHEDEESVHEAEEAELPSGDSIFDNPFFNLEQVKKYFSTLERALGHVFRQTVDEAILLNGTYANTTEEEVEIDGKKYIIMKSVIKGGDNHSSLYVESLSSKPKMNDSEIIEDFKITNVTRR